MRAKRGFCFFHGWGFDKTFWDPLAALLPKPHTYFDRGYWGSPQEPCFDLAEHWIGIGHSLGWHTMMMSDTSRFTAFVGINGFHAFGAQPRVLDRMIKKFETQPDQVLRDFYKQAGLTSFVHAGIMHLDKLYKDLIRLRALPALSPMHTPRLMLASKQDLIVPYQYQKTEFIELQEKHTHTSAHHALGFLEAEWCAVHIREVNKS